MLCQATGASGHRLDKTDKGYGENLGLFCITPELLCLCFFEGFDIIKLLYGSTCNYKDSNLQYVSEV